MRLSRETVGELVAVLGAVLLGCGVFLWFGVAATLGYAGAVLVVLGVMMALTTGASEGSR